MFYLSSINSNYVYTLYSLLHSLLWLVCTDIIFNNTTHKTIFIFITITITISFIFLLFLSPHLFVYGGVEYFRHSFPYCFILFYHIYCSIKVYCLACGACHPSARAPFDYVSSCFICPSICCVLCQYSNSIFSGNLLFSSTFFSLKP